MSVDFTNLKCNLEKKGYHVHMFETKEAATDYIDGQLDGKTIGIGGSETVKQMQLFPKIAAHNTVFWHSEKPENYTVMETRITMDETSKRMDVSIPDLEKILNS